VTRLTAKREIHNVYYYQHRRAKPEISWLWSGIRAFVVLGQLRHEKEDKGKVSSYNLTLFLFFTSFIYYLSVLAEPFPAYRRFRRSHRSSTRWASPITPGYALLMFS